MYTLLCLFCQVSMRSDLSVGNRTKIMIGQLQYKNKYPIKLTQTFVDYFIPLTCKTPLSLFFKYNMFRITLSIFSLKVMFEVSLDLSLEFL